MSSHWKQRPEGGSRLSLWLIRNIARHGGRPLARIFLVPITLYYLVMRGPERRASRDYLSRVFGQPASLIKVARHIHTFAATILDRVYLLGGRFGGFEVNVTGLPELHEVLDRRQGVLLFGAHLGSFEVLRVLARQRPEHRIRVVLDKAQNPAITKMLDALNPEIAAGVIDAGFVRLRRGGARQCGAAQQHQHRHDPPIRCGANPPRLGCLHFRCPRNHRN